MTKPTVRKPASRKPVAKAKTFRILCVNPGSTSTKIALFDGPKPVFVEELSHSEKELAPFHKIADQFQFRVDAIEKVLRKKKLDLATLSAIVGRGGLIMPIPSGVYGVNELMLEHLKDPPLGEHASNLGALIAHEISRRLDLPAYIVDPVVVDELDDVARISGLKEIPRVSIFHALNQKAIARQAAAKLKKPYEKLNLIIAHLGGGITVGSHRKGRIVEVNDGVNGEGPFTPERTGMIPAIPLLRMAFSGNYTHDQLKKMIKGKGGLVSLLGTNSCLEVEKRIAAGDAWAKTVYDAMFYQLAKEIGAAAAVLEGKVDAVILTGGVAKSKYGVDAVKRRVRFIAPVLVYPGGDEMAALAGGVLPVLQGKTRAKEYKG